MTSPTTVSGPWFSMAGRPRARPALASPGAASTTSDRRDRKSTRLNSSHRCISYAVFCWRKNEHAPGVADLGYTLGGDRIHRSVQDLKRIETAGHCHQLLRQATEQVDGGGGAAPRVL